ncbi:unnamed protein product, partial [Chrysoparadoxa australica]
MQLALGRKVSWEDMEKIMRDKADVTALKAMQSQKLDAHIGERLEAAVQNLCSREEVCSLVQRETSLLRALQPQLERLLEAKERDDKEKLDRGPGSAVSREALPGLVED